MPRWPARSALDRFNSKVVIDESGCHLWTGCTSSGYARFRIGGQTVYGHRWIWEQLVGPIPDGHEIDHVKDRGCHYRHCVNLAHLEPVTSLVNNQRVTNRRPPRRREACKRGHVFTDETTYQRPDGKGRQCWTCIKMRSAQLHIEITPPVGKW